MYVLIRLSLALRRTLRAYLARPDLCTVDHDRQVYELGRLLGHAALRERPDLAPGESMRY